MAKPAPGGKAKLVGNAIKYGPIIFEGVRRYGPALRDQIVENKDVLQSVVPHRALRGEARKNALAHADSVVDGSAMQCFHQAREYWVVFSGETPIGVHPFTNVPYGELLRHADLGKRVRPSDRPARGIFGRVAGAVAPKKGNPRPSRPQPYAPGSSTRPGRPAAAEEPIEGEII